MNILYTDVPPLRTQNNDKNFRDTFNKYVKSADSISIASGYVAQDALEHLNKLVEQNNIKHIDLILGMYFIEGMPENIFNCLKVLDTKWHSTGIGQIHIVRAFRYHGKCYLFSHDNKPFAGIIGSANLSAIALNSHTRRQYELSVAISESNSLNELQSHFHQLIDNCSSLLNETPNIPIIRQENTKLRNVEHVQRVNADEVSTYKRHYVGNTIEIPLKVPKDHQDPKLRKSNINVCYAKGRHREWWETEIVTSDKIYSQPGYPQYRQPFMVVTDDGWKFEAWTAGSNNKNFYSKDDLKILGYWLKGRLVAAGIVQPIDHVEDDTEFKGLITEEMLKQYGRTSLSLRKTTQTTKDEHGKTVNVWVLSFLPDKSKED